jgi:alpha-ketoglutarate-dependent taurine dioxygenase
MLFFCLKSPTVGGETLLVDGAEIRSALVERADALETTRIAYVTTYNLKTERKFVDGFLTSIGVKSLNEVRPVVDALAKRLLGDNEEFKLEISDEEIVYKYIHPLTRKARWSGEKVVCGAFEVPGSLRQTDGSLLAPETGELFREIIDCGYMLAYFHKWQSGDLLIVNNCRIMHGRNAFSDKQRNIIVRMGLIHR